MSLINQMLKDLETRSRPATAPAVSGLQATVVKKKNRRKNYFLMAALFLLIPIWLWNITHYYRHHHPVLAKTPVHKALPVVARSFQVPPVSSPKVIALAGISMQVHGKMTNLRFLLDHETVYQLDSDPLQHQLMIILKNTQLKVNLPPLDFVNSALANLQVDTHELNQVRLILSLKPEAHLSNLEMNKDNNSPELLADFLMETAAQSEPIKATLKKTSVDSTPEEVYQDASNLAAAGDTEKAINKLSALVDLHPSYHHARETLITLSLKQGYKEKAALLVVEGLRLEPNYPAFVEFRAHALVDEGKILEALKLLKKAPPTLVSHPDYYAFLAALYQRMGQLNSAESLYQQLTSLNPDNGVWWLGLGVTEEGLGKTAQAMDAYNRADRSSDLDPELRGYVGSRLRG